MMTQSLLAWLVKAEIILVILIIIAIPVLIFLIRWLRRWKHNQEQLAILKHQVDGASDAIITIDKNLLITNWNKGAEKLFGYTKEEAKGKRTADLLRIEMSKDQQIAIQRFVEKKGHWTGEVKRYAKNNRPIYVISSITAIYNNRGEFTGYISVNYDITEQRKLREEVNHLAAIVEHSSEAILSCGIGKKVVSWNEGAERLFGFSKHEAIGKTAAELGFVRFTPEESEELDNQVAANGKWKTEKIFYHKNGNTFIGEVTADVMFYDGETPQSTLYIIRDISAHKNLSDYLQHAKDALEAKVQQRTEEIYKAESRYRETLENMLEGVQILDHDLRYIYVNEALARQSNMRRTQLTGRLVTELFPGVEQTDLYKTIVHCLKEQEPKQLDSDFTFPNGKTKHFQLNLQPVPEGIFILSIDITDKKIAEELQKDEQKKITWAMLEGQEKERTFIGRELHDNISQILAAVKMKISLYLKSERNNTDLLEQSLRYTQSALEETRNLSHNMVLPRFHLGSFETEINRLLSDYSAAGQKVQFNMESPDTTIPVPTQEMLYRIIQEQLNNIQKHAAASIINIYIKTSPNKLTLEITDNGKGFNMQRIKKGIGLSNIHNRAELLGGAVKIISAPGNGCTLTIGIPLDYTQQKS